MRAWSVATKIFAGNGSKRKEMGKGERTRMGEK